jgi:hypothetical protein
MTHTEAPAPQPDEIEGHTAEHHGDGHVDPLHDIDGPKTTYAVVGSLVLIVGMCWGMAHLYNIMVQVERQAKIGDIVPKELIAIRKAHNAELNGENPNRGTKTIDQAIAEYLKK